MYRGKLSLSPHIALCVPEGALDGGQIVFAFALQIGAELAEDGTIGCQLQRRLGGGALREQRFVLGFRDHGRLRSGNDGQELRAGLV